MAYEGLKSLYGGAAALGGTVGGQDREQEAWSPTWFLEAAATALGGRIPLDPCGASAWALPAAPKRGRDGLPVLHTKGKRAGQPVLVRDAIEGGWFADLTLTGPGGFEGPSPHGGYVAAVDGRDGASWAQAGGAYVNPEYADLDLWLEAMLACARTGCPVVGLFPVRSRRQWWADAVRAPGAELVCLRYDVVFQGYHAAHPENMCGVAWNCRLPPLGARETWRV